MILADLTDAGRYACLHPLFPRVFAFLAAGSHEGLAEGRHAIDGDRLAVIVETGTTKDPGVKRLECHRRYIDVQVVLAGGERMGWAKLDGLVEHVPYDAGKDLRFFADPAGGAASILVLPGQFAIFFPEDAHKPGCHPAGAPVAYRKLVFKVAV
jgi:biofilm protein TabA